MTWPFRIIEVCFARMGLHVERSCRSRAYGHLGSLQRPGFGRSPDRPTERANLPPS